jgi:hypothetical protein
MNEKWANKKGGFRPLISVLYREAHAQDQHHECNLSAMRNQKFPDHNTLPNFEFHTRPKIIPACTQATSWRRSTTSRTIDQSAHHPGDISRERHHEPTCATNHQNRFHFPTSPCRVDDSARK